MNALRELASAAVACITLGFSNPAYAELVSVSGRVTLAYNASKSGNSGDTSNLFDQNAGLVDGQIFPGGFSLFYDPSQPVFAGTAGISFERISIPYADLYVEPAALTVTSFFRTPGRPCFGCDPSVALDWFVGFYLTAAPGTTLSLSTLPVSYYLKDFSEGFFKFEVHDWKLNGLSLAIFDVVDIQVDAFTIAFPDRTAPTPLPATLPLFASALGAMCMLTWCRRCRYHF